MTRMGLLASAVIAMAQITAAQAETVLSVAIPQDLRGTNPGVNRDGDTDTIMMHVVEGLTAYAADFSVKPMLAESWEMSEDGRVYTFKLRPDVKFHNGELMTAEHVKWSWDRYMDPDTNWRCRGYFVDSDDKPNVEMSIVDEDTVVFRLAEPNATFLGNLSRFDCGSTAILHPSSVNEDGSWRAPVSTGPFVFGDIRPGRYVDLVKFPDYVSRTDAQDAYAGAKEAMVDRIRHHILPEASVAKAAFLAGELDVLTIDSADIDELSRRENAQILQTDTAGWNVLLINDQKPPFNDQRMRQAVAQAIDRDQVAEILSEGRGTSDPSPIPPVSSYFTEVQNQALPFDPAQSRELLESAGYDGEAITIMTNKNAGTHYQIAMIVQSMLKNAGFNVDLNVLEWGAQLDAYQKGDYQLQAFSYSARLDPALSFEMITGDEPRKVWRNPEAISLVQKAMVTADKDERQAIIDELHTRFISEAPAIGLGHRMQYFVIADGIEGFAPWGGGKQIYWGVSKN